MGSYIQAHLEELDRQQERMSRTDWPRCVRCGEAVEFELVVEGVEEGNFEELMSSPEKITTAMLKDVHLSCEYCHHIASKDD